jgi:hypothetical protein
MGRLLSEDSQLAENLSKTLAERSNRTSQMVASHHESKVVSQKQVDENAAKAAILRRIRGFFKL